MKSKIILLFFLSLTAFSISCQKEAGVLTKEDIIQTLVEDKDFIEHVRLITESEKNILSGKVNLSSLDATKIEAHTRQSETSDEVYEYIEKSGIQGADLMAENLKKRTELITSVVKKYPVLSKMKQEDLIDIFQTSFKKVIENLNEDISPYIKNKLDYKRNKKN